MTMPSSTTVTKGIRGDFGWMFQLLSGIMSALAIVALARHAFVTWSLSAPMALIMDAYNGVMQVLFGWAHPYLQAALTWLGSFIGWRPTLYPHWKDVFVVVSLTGVGMGRVFLLRSRRAGLGLLSRVHYTVALEPELTIAPILGAAVTALAAGLLPLQSPDLVVQLLIAASLGLAVLPSFALWFTGDRILLSGLVVASATSAFAALMTWLLSLVVGHTGGLGLAGLATVVVLTGFLLRFFGVISRVPGHRTNAFVVSRTILGGFVGAFVFFAIDAGLKLLMG